MPFDSGSQSFIMCSMPKELPEDCLRRFHEKRAHPLESVREEPQIGWVSGRHLLETRIEDETAYFGGFLNMNLRTAVRKIPSALFKAQCRMEELAYMQANQTFNVPRKQKKMIKEDLQEKMIKDMPPSLSAIPFAVDANHGILYLGATSQSQIDSFLIYFYETIGFEPVPLYPEILAESVFGQDVDGIEPLIFTPEETLVDEVPTLGRDFTTWLWYFQEEEGGTFTVDNYGDFAIMIDGPLTFAAEGAGAMESVVRKGLPTISAEAKAALMVGKKLKSAKFTISRDKDVWTFGMDADSFVLRGMKLPDGEELDPMSHFQERMLFFNIFREAFLKLFDLFLQQVSDASQVENLNKSLSQWVENMKTS